MEKLIACWSYWLGVACLVISVICRAVYASAVWRTVTLGHTSWYLSTLFLSFFHASILFFVVTIATACYVWLKSQKP